MDHITVRGIISIVIAIVFILYTLKSFKQKGQYEQVECLLTFMQNRLIWEYPAIDLQDGKGPVHLKYYIDWETILDVSVSNELNSVRLACNPRVERTYQNGKTEEFDIDKKSCILIMYNYDINDIINKYIKYFNITPNVVD